MYLFFKRFFDILAAASLLLVLSPFWFAVIILLIVSGNRKVFYFQKRVGRNNKPFYLWKFQTMMPHKETTGNGLLSVKDDNRVTKLGHYLRKTKLDEIPQLINIIRGEMSFVGPRPLIYTWFKLYAPDIQKKIYTSRPGLTGVGSLVFRNEETLLANCGINPHEFYQNTILPYKGICEMWYLEHKSIFLDIKLLFLTAIMPFLPKNIDETKLFKGLPKKNF
ncbi:MAG: sugar transferase [Bacteroidales bacterium]|jgi:lipopolysaccharide/colanic/teichoic acid biosynthesis glycosyltransferase|nr:sugar transferase [Bacteroidales bacterium]